jgi:MerR family mercuric resistance operon transcriptional regulator
MVRRDLTIGAVSKSTGCNTETIRYYERVGLLDAPARTSGGHRVYTPDQVKQLAFVRRCRELGFGLEDVRSLMELAEGHAGSCETEKNIALEHVGDVRRKINDLRRMETRLRDLASKCVGDTVPACPVIEALYREP